MSWLPLLMALSVIANLTLANPSHSPSGLSDGPHQHLKMEKPKPVQTRLDCSAISNILVALKGQLPRNGKELVKALSSFGEINQAAIPFSDAPNPSSLSNPR